MTSTLDVLDRLIDLAQARQADQIDRLRNLVGRSESITEAMRAMVEIEDDLVILNDQRIL